MWPSPYGRRDTFRHLLWRTATIFVTLNARDSMRRYAAPHRECAAKRDRSKGAHTMATQQEREAFLRGWRTAMDEVLSVLASEARDWQAEEADAAASGEYKLPGS